MENLWGILCRTVYADGKQYNNVGELRTSIISAWENVNVYVLQKLVNSMCDRLRYLKWSWNRALSLAIKAGGCIEFEFVDDCIESSGVPRVGLQDPLLANPFVAI